MLALLRRFDTWRPGLPGDARGRPAETRGIIGTAAMIGIALASAGATAATNIYGTKKAASVNEKSITAQAASEEASRKAELEAQASQNAANAAEAEKQRQATAAEAEQRRQAEIASRNQYYAFEKQRWDDYVRVHQPSWNVGSSAFNSLAGMLGVAGGGGTPNVGSSAPTPSPAIFTPGSPVSSPTATTAGAPGSGQVPSIGRSSAQAYPRMATPASAAPMSLQDLLMLASRRATPTTGLQA